MNTRYLRIAVPLLVLALFTLSCGFPKLTKTSSEPLPAAQPQNTGQERPTQEEAQPAAGNPQPAAPQAVSEFPTPKDAEIQVAAGGTTILTTKLSIKESMAFCRDAFSQKGLKEDQQLTATTDTTFSMVFRGDPSGKMLVVQGTDMGNGTTTISLSYE
jgi:hypothetical protein